MDTFIKVGLMMIGLLVVAAGVGLLIAFPVMWCWNYAVVPVWHLPEITWGQAWCLNFLAHLMIKSSSTTNTAKKG